MARPSGTFIREATGLVKELSLVDSIVYNLSITTPGLGLLLYTYFGPATFPGVNLLIPLLLITPFLLFHSITSGQMMAVMPRSGFDYVFVSRMTRPFIGFANSFTFFIFQGTLAGSFFVLLVSYISNYFGSLSLVTGNAAYGSTAANIVQPIPTLAIATILNVIITIITLVGLRFSKRALIGIQAIAWLSLFVALGIIAANGPASFGSAWNHYLGSQLNYSNATAVAQAKGLTYQSGISPIFVATFWAFFSILGYQSVGYLGGEVKKSSTTIIRSMVTALLISVAILGLGTYIIENTIGYSFLASSTFLSATGQLSVAPYFALIASVLAPNVGIISFIYLGLSLWLVVLLMGLFLLLTRTIFAWSFDGVVPFVFSNVSRRFASPIWSCVLIGVLMELGIIIGIFSVLGSFLNLSVVFLLTYSVNTLTSALLPVLKPDWFNNAPSIARYRIGGKLPLISLMGGITTLFFWFLIYEIFLNPSIAGAINAYSASAIVIVAVVGATIYFGARSYRKSRGMDLSGVFGEIPPE